MKKLLLIVALVASLAVAQEATKKQDAKKSESKKEMKAKDTGKASMPGHKLSTASALEWGPAPSILPSGAQVAVLEGDPGKAGEFTIRLKMPAGYKIPPHWHPATEHVTVISGNVYLGMGDKFDESQAQKLGAGDFIYMRTKQKHFAGATSESVVQLHGSGPWKLVYVNPSDDPSAKK